MPSTGRIFRVYHAYKDVWLRYNQRSAVLLLLEIIADRPFGSGTAAKQKCLLSSGGTYTETRGTGL